MSRIKLIISMLSVFATFTLFASSAQAQVGLFKTYVSNSGSLSSSNCDSGLPCASFAAAIAKTRAGGEIVVLDSGDYGPVTITKSVTINGDGSAATITASGNTGITINAGASDVVTIRGVAINGVSFGGTGIKYQSGKQVLIENCSISGLFFNGVDVALSAPGNLVIKNTTIQGLNNGSSIQNGVKQTTAGGALNAMLEDVRITGNYNGVELVNGSVTLSRSSVSQNSNIGVLAGGAINIESSSIVSNAIGVQANAGATIRLSNVNILNNTTGISILPGGIVASFGNNRIAGNTTPGAPNQLLSQQ